VNPSTTSAHLILEDTFASLAFRFASAFIECKKNDSHPEQPHETSDYTVGNFTLGSIFCELESKTTIDDAKCDDGPTPPDMWVSCTVGSTSMLVQQVMDETSDRLKEKRPNDDKTDNGVNSINLIRSNRNPYSHAHACEHYDVCKHHPPGMEPNKISEAHNPDSNGTEGKEKYECDGCHDSMCHPHDIIVCWNARSASSS